MPADCIAYLEKVKSKKEKERQANSAPQRRMSVAGVPLFSINDEVIESSGDYFERIPRPSVSAINGPPIIAPTDNSLQNAERTTTTIESEISSKENVAAESISNESEQMDLVDEPKVTVGNNALPVEEAENSTTAEAPASNNVADGVSVGRLSIVNNFDPFRRLPNVPFAMVGRIRRSSMFEMYRSMDTIME